ncbi:abortive infection system toxin AbiGii family protein [Clostridium sporogenes]|uniref:abortive infection system toxin AbiGii family protein n=1 Tax=Clostridium sporogenes TaxID=1509 RepID=UPI000665DCC7|nr:abortive infection system toxin AbiGii family protein [Clostridium sporogenes]MCF4017194.1 abortive infection system toxin AbiGii family protein [Clostridium sporogenes]
MFSNFKKAFKPNEVSQNIPEEVIKSLNKELPEGFRYANIGEGVCAINSVEDKFDLSAKIEMPSYLPSDFKPSTIQDVMEFAYRSQRRLKIIPNENGCININGKEINVNDIIKYPFEKIVNNELFISPEPFNPPFTLSIEGNSIKKELLIKRQPYEDMNKSLFKNINNESINLEYLIDEKMESMKINFSINIEKAKSINEVIECLKLYDAFIKKDIKINGMKLSKITNGNIKKNENILKTIDFWQKVHVVEQKLNANFNPRIPIKRNDAYVIKKLYRSLIEKKPYKEYIDMNEIEIVAEKNGDIKIGSQLEITSIQQSKIEFSEDKFELFDIVGLFGFQISDIKIVNKEKNKYKLLIEPIKDEKIYMSTQHFIKLEEAQDHINDVEKLKNADLIVM